MEFIYKEHREEDLDGQLNVKIEKVVAKKVKIYGKKPHTLNVHEMVRQYTKKIVSEYEESLKRSS